MNKIKTMLRQNKFIYYCYHYVFSLLFRFIGLFVKTDNNLILFNSYGGKKYDDSPKAIYEYMKKNKKYSGYRMVWALDNLNLVDDKDINVVKNDTIRFFLLALKAKYWISNTAIERGLTFKKKGTIYINTWHGSAFKKIGRDMLNNEMNYIVTKPDYFYAQSTYDVNIFSKALGLKKEKIFLTGLPRNDELCNINNEEIKKIKRELNIPLNKKVLLYAPTFREYDYDNDGCIIAPPINLKKWQEELGDNYILLFRAHYYINKVLNIEENDFIINVSNYPCLNKLLKISDILISDYSSIMFDYSILERPIYSYAYDYDTYSKKRGLYIDLNKELPNGVFYTEQELLDAINNCDFKLQKEKTKKFKNKYIQVVGNASGYIDNIIK